VERSVILREMPIMIAAAGALALLGLDGRIGRIDGLLLVVAFVGYLVFVLRAARQSPARVELEADYDTHERDEGIAPAAAPRWRNILLVIAGLAGLVVGGELLVRAAVYFARAAGVSDLVIGLTVVAVGTSLPELATSVIAAARREVDIAMGNIVGSNIFNVLAVLGLAALVAPLTVDRGLFRFEIPAMVVLSLALPLLARSGLRIGRLEGIGLVAVYVAFTVGLLVRAG
jgi:cation:H+ antiporter